ncbi:GxxExxY protein [Pelagicoccus sp. SDUM812005]|uniref:GxxExxY protein n=1 Tax=Pelagicoccus sp. SDUM812005 TaxID=3041257 RepID=UPI00280F8566|nr:GxxExxY protein [Pelagicoccus sp. SDUM812005]MDQ8180823.1 GxxExxY protein [Pelagicoccus sp. SDUM812005]
MIQDPVTSKIITIAHQVHAELGHGFNEKIFENSLAIALTEDGFKVSQQHPIDVHFRGHLVGEFFADILVDDTLILELKALTALAPEHHAQLINYIKAANLQTGLLLNFGAPKLQVKRAYHPNLPSRSDT